MRSARLAVATAVAATALLVASPAQARHVCGLDDVNETLDQICETHPEDTTLIRKLLCLISTAC